jgi:tetratricopeptide (TPR) repeat protein
VLGKPLPHFDVHAPLLSLPHLLGLPDPKDCLQPPYLCADPKLIDHWKAELGKLKGFKIGINWQGNPKHSKDSFRSIPLAQFLPLAKVPGVRLISLQKGFGKEQLEALPDPGLILDLGSKLDENTGAFVETAAVLHSLDLVITSDTALAHLAGALGRPVWVALPASPDWRWLLTGETTSWYPSMRLFRQSKLKDWSDVVAQMASELDRMVSATPEEGRSPLPDRLPPETRSIEEMLQAGQTAYQAGDYAKAEQTCRHILAQDSTHASAWHVLGLVMENTGRKEPAVQYLHEAVRLKPDFAEAHHNLGIVLQSIGRSAEAIQASRRSLILAPHNADAHVNIGDALRDSGRPDDAIAEYQAALRLKPKHPEALNNLGMVCLDLGRPAEAAPHFNAALALDPDYAPAHRNMALVHLLAGEYDSGWAEYEWRWKTKPFARPKLPGPLWDGEDLTGKTILIHTEQGLGDSLQFVRYLRILRDRGARVLLGCPPKLEPLLKTLPDIDQLIVEGQPLPAFDVHAPLLSLPHLLRLPDPQDSPRPPYLTANPKLIEQWKAELSELGGFKVGINWQGSPANKKDPVRSIPLAHFLPLADVPGVHLISLQKGFGREQLSNAERGDRILDLGSRLDESTGPFMDTAALLHGLDLLITADTAVAHLAGALNRPVWVALSKAPDWRWRLSGETTPWYPSMRLFRQTTLGEWEDVFTCIASELTRAVRAK